MELKNCLPKGLCLPITVQGEDIFIAHPESKNIRRINDLLTSQEKMNILHVGRAIGVVADSDNIRICCAFNFHTHSEFSLLDGLSSIKDIAEKSSGVTAITDHGNMYGMFKFVEAMKKAGKKPVIGCEVYVETVIGREKHGNHLILLAKNETGKRNLFILVSNAYNGENFYRKPHVPLSDLEKYHEGIICTSACLAGELANTINEDYEKAREVVQFYHELFKDDYYIELQRHGIEAEEKAEPLLVKLAKEEGVKTVCANDSHYLNKEDAEYHEILLCVSCKKKISEPDHLSFDGTGYWYMTDEEIINHWWDMPEAVANTLEIAEKCNTDIETGVYHLPMFPLPEGVSEVEYLKELIQKGFHDRFYGTPAYTDSVYLERLKYETETIVSMGFAAYFLIVQEFIAFAKTNGIYVGPGRGSAAGSLVAYCLKITELDPIKHSLLFERFLNPDRISMPDIDTDFEDSRRPEVIEHCKDLYGVSNVCNIVTFGCMQTKNAIRDVVRATVGDYALGDRLSKMVSSKAKNLKDAMEMNPELSKLYETDSKIRIILDAVSKLEGHARQSSTHACGIVIAGDEIVRFLPTAMVHDEKTDSKSLTSQMTMTEVESMGLLKMDFLGLKTLTVIHESLDLANEVRKQQGVPEIGYYREIPLNDPYVYAEISSGKSFAVFQIESDGMRSFMQNLFWDVRNRISKIEEKYKMSGFGVYVKGDGDKDAYMQEMEELGNELFDRMIAGISLYRPGPMDYIPEYLENMKNPENIHYDVPQLEPILKDTYAVIVYQEQVMQIVRELAGFSMGQADVIRKAMGKKKQAILDEYKPYFLHGSGDALDEHTGKPLGITGCTANGIPEETAERIWEKMSDFAKYAFNKSHAAAYSVITMTCAYLKHYYPSCYMCAMLNAYINNDKLRGYISVTKNMGIEILPPAVNLSSGKFKTDGTAIRFGIGGLKGISKCVVSIEEEHEKNGDFSSFEDFVLRNPTVNKKCLESLILTGYFDCFPHSRKAKVNALKTVIKSAKKRLQDRQSGQFSFFDEVFLEAEIEDCEEYPKRELLNLEKENSGMYISEHPLDEYSEILEHMNITETGLISDDEGNVSEGSATMAGVLTSVEILYTKKDQKPMAKIVIEDRSGSIKGVIFPDDYSAYSHLLVKGSILCIKGEIRNDEDFGLQLVCKNISDIRSLSQHPVSKIYVKLGNDKQALLVNDILNEHKGDVPVYAQYNGTIMQFQTSVTATSSLYMELQNVCGGEYVKFVI